VEPVPATSEALDELAAMGDPGLRDELGRMGRMVRLIVPECFGLSLGVVREGLTFTLVASDDDVAALDAVQYVDGGPCVDATHGEKGVVETRPDELLDEDHWQLFARASAASQVQSTLSLPIGHEDEIVAGVNLYASTEDAFVGHHRQLALALGAWVPGIVTNADLSFSTRAAADRAPERIRGQADINLAIGALAEARRLAPSEAAERLRAAAVRAGVGQEQVARMIVSLLLPG
jgi:transcriptional regulator with GAF, ATPase, and Fis domain